ncbi:S-adenosylmethionine decarboxylase [Hymenobacter sp. HMF4947]|uniref:S-adenosylmethionine decarboxylase n=1 Tax=Hymenobacter ginkgonis TaxID=2682976 RepID=A0A7K1TIC9_9BACT|nr:S-adenosylmethionine decarboxylase [Hymenobacter ginkgonis]MVN78170.1 S-adenosylmethionine decarboxylase [Hymenobacter ginkgonis]
MTLVLPSTLATAPALPPPYAPGLHVLATFGAPAARLRDAAGSQRFFAALVAQLGLTSVGEVYHVFAENAGFTAVLALTESHLSIHTWPEHELATFDVFLSNFRQDNHATVRAVYQATLAFFEGEARAYAEVLR